MPFYPRERGIILTVFAKNGGVNAPLSSSLSHSWAPDPKIYKSSSGITVQFLFNRLSSSFGISLFLFVWEGGWYFLPRILAYTNFHFVHEMCLTKISSETKLSWTKLSFHVLFQLHKMSDKHCTSNSRSTNMKFLTYLVFGHPNRIFLLFLNFVYYPWVPIVHGARRDYSWNNNVKFKVVFRTLYQIDFRTATKSHPVLYEHLSDMWLSTLEIGAAQLHSVTEIAPKSPFLCVNRIHIRYSFCAGATEAIRNSVSIA